jgi:glycosyltransferase involved in cell wall biosynthesis
MGESIIVVTGKWYQNSLSISKTCLKLVNIIDKLDCHVVLFTPRSDMVLENNHELVVIDSNESSNKFLSYIYFLIYQIRLSLTLIDTIRSKKVASVLFCFGGDLLVFPMIISKILGKSIIIRSDSRPSVADRCIQKSWINVFVFETFENIAYRLADRIILESESMVSFYGFQKYEHKIRVGPLYVNTDLFSAVIPITNRKYDVGYIGRLSPEKGFLEFLEAIKLLPSDYSILIIGDGPLSGKAMAAKSASPQSIDFLGWIENENLPHYYNQIKLFVLPSHKEGLPNSILEAMACGTPVLATPVGGVPWVLMDGVTGYILQNRSPATIAQTIVRISNDRDLEAVIRNGIELIEEKHSFSRVVANYNDIFRDVISKAGSG